FGCDFYCFSGHKIYAAPGTGVVYGRKEVLDTLPPYMGGGEMIASVSWNSITYAPIPGRFEAGTQNMAGVPTLKEALAIARTMKDIQDYSDQVRDYVLQELRDSRDVVLFGDPLDSSKKIPLFSFAVKGAHHEDLALIMDKMGIALRSGQMCAEPLMDRFGVPGMLRASFAPYNTLEEARYFIESLHKAVKMLK
ncbi:MAG: aminotransferase class V-fold PLP-dependent enzyme, partial [Bacteroidales bacterium]|nr:aminotransferase class V-fold PLP-dependent enzyme [Bacteroidales bacterium]